MRPVFKQHKTCFCLTVTSIRAADKIICINSDCRIGNKNVLMEISLIRWLASLWNVIEELYTPSRLSSCLKYKPYYDAENMRSSSSFNVVLWCMCFLNGLLLLITSDSCPDFTRSQMGDVSSHHPLVVPGAHGVCCCGFLLWKPCVTSAA